MEPASPSSPNQNEIESSSEQIQKDSSKPMEVKKTTSTKKSASKEPEVKKGTSKDAQAKKKDSKPSNTKKSSSNEEKNEPSTSAAVPKKGSKDITAKADGKPAQAVELISDQVAVNYKKNSYLIYMVKMTHEQNIFAKNLLPCTYLQKIYHWKFSFDILFFCILKALKVCSPFFFFSFYRKYLF